MSKKNNLNKQSTYAKELNDRNKNSLEESKMKFKDERKKGRGKVNLGKKKKEIIKIRRTVQDTIPYYAVYPNGVIEIEPSVFSRLYEINDANFRVATDEEQENMFEIYRNFLNSFDANTSISVTINNRNIDEADFLEDILIKENDDGMDEFREEYNDMLKEKIAEGKNNLHNEKYLTVTIKAPNIDKATSEFDKLDMEISKNIKRITDVDTEPISTKKTLEILHDIYNLGHEGEFDRERTVFGKKVYSYNLEALKPSGLTTKDIIGPSNFRFYKDYFECGDTYGCSLYLQTLPNRLKTEFIAELTEIPCNMLTTIHYDPIDPAAARKLVSKQITNIQEDVINAQKRASKNMYSVDLIPPALQKAQTDAEMLYEEVNSNNQKLFLVTLAITVFADTLEDLENNIKSVISEANRHVCVVKKMSYLQELCFDSSLPIGVNQISVTKLLTSENSAIFIPFTSKELSDRNGMYYGLNSISKNMILYDRTSGKNGNGLVLGSPGTGKSFAVKREITNVRLNHPNDVVYVIDPENEYAALAKALKGEVVTLAVGSKNYLNPFDLSLATDDIDPITIKSDFICSLCETIMNGNFMATTHKSIVDRCIRKLYRPYLEQISNLNKNRAEGTPEITADTKSAPTLIDFYENIISQPEAEAQTIGLALELYAEGSFDLFSHRTNVNTNSNFVVFNTKDLGTQMRELGLQVCLNEVWTRMLENQKKGIRTWIYIDEFHLLVRTPNSAEFVKNIWKRSRKWGGIPTGLTQNVNDLITSDAAEAVLTNSEFIMMLGQSAVDRDILSQLLNISPSQLSYITNSGPGEGLIHTGRTIVPFKDAFPKNKLYSIMTTKADERKMN